MTTCTGPECDRTDIYAKDLCSGHYCQRRRGHDLKPLRVNRPPVPCEGPQCDREATATARLCKSHQDQVKRGSGVLKPLMVRTKRGPKAPPVATVGDPCTGPECRRTTRSPTTGLCRAHLEQRRAGKELRPLRVMTRREGPPNLPGGWFNPTVEKPRNPGNGPGGNITHDTIGIPQPLTDDQRLNTAIVVAGRGRTITERRELLAMLGLDDLTTRTKAA